MIFSNINQITIFSTDFEKSHYQVPYKSSQWEPHSYKRRNRRINGYEANICFSIFMLTHTIKEDIDTLCRYEKFIKYLCGKKKKKKLTGQA
jgi:hypothetical protein